MYHPLYTSFSHFSCFHCLKRNFHQLPKTKLSPKMRYTDNEIKLFLLAGHSHYQIAKNYHVSPKRITRISRNIESNGPGRPRKLTDEHKAYIAELFFVNPRMTISKASLLFAEKFSQQISMGSISTILRENHLRYTKPLKVQKLRYYHKIIRYNFAISLTESHPDAEDPFWKSLIFSDESRFCANSDSIRIWKKMNDFRPDVQQAYEKFEVGVMVWGAVGINFKSNLVFCGSSINSTKYLSILEESKFYEQVRNSYSNREYLFQQDGAPAHTSKETLDKLLKELKVLLGWPPNSPDLSPIEMCWAIMKKRISHGDNFPTTNEQLKQRIQEEWDRLDQEMINQLVFTFRDRLLSVIKTRGETISQYLSARKTSEEIPENTHVSIPELFTKEDDQSMFEYFMEKGRRWTAISHILGDKFPPQVIKYRVLCLLAEKRINELRKESFEVPNTDISDDRIPITVDPEDEHNHLNSDTEEEERSNKQRKRRKPTFAFTIPQKKHEDEISGDSFEDSDEEIQYSSKNEKSESQSDDDSINCFLSQSGDDDILLTSK